MRELVARRPAIRLVLVGGGFLFRDFQVEDERLRKLARDLKLDGQIQFVGPKSQREVATIMRQSAMVVLPSRAESFGATLLEALACGVPVVATRSGGPEEIVTSEVGRLVPTEDAAALAEAMDWMLEHHGTFNPKQLRRYVLDNFSWERIASQIADLYHTAVERYYEPGRQETPEEVRV
jgi:glycosyltransferase involved in cell wall biosynthesis